MCITDVLGIFEDEDARCRNFYRLKDCCNISVFNNKLEC